MRGAQLNALLKRLVGEGWPSTLEQVKQASDEASSSERRWKSKDNAWRGGLGLGAWLGSLQIAGGERWEEGGGSNRLPVGCGG